jgi:acyl-CoA thioester hydrolase
MTDYHIHYAPLRVEFEDCDSMGVVYHPKYLSFIERSRVDFLRDHGIAFSELMRSGYAMVIGEIHANYWRPAKFEEELHVYTRQVLCVHKKISIEQVIVRDKLSAEEQLFPMSRIRGRVFGATIGLTSINLQTMRSAPLPDHYESILSALTVQISEI